MPPNRRLLAALGILQFAFHESKFGKLFLMAPANEKQQEAHLLLDPSISSMLVSSPPLTCSR